MARHWFTNLRILCLLAWILSLFATINADDAVAPPRANSYRPSRDRGIPLGPLPSFSTSTMLSPHRVEPKLCLIRGTTLEQTRNLSRNYYECPGKYPLEYTDCCEKNSCCMPSYVRQLLNEK